MFLIPESTADNPTYAEIGDHLRAGMCNMSSLPLSAGIVQAQSKHRSGSSTLPLMSDPGYSTDNITDGFPSTPEGQLYQEPDVVLVARSKTIAYARNDPKPEDSDGYMGLNYHSRATVPQHGQSKGAYYLTILPENTPVEVPDYNVPRPVQNTQSTENMIFSPTSTASATDHKGSHNHSPLVRENESKPTGGSYVDIDYPQNDSEDFPCSPQSKEADTEVIGTISQSSRGYRKDHDFTDGEDGKIPRPTAPHQEGSLYVTLENDSNLTNDSKISNVNQVYFTLENQSSSQKSLDTIDEDFNAEKINTGDPQNAIKRPKELHDSVINESPQTTRHYIECVQETCNTLDRDNNADKVTIKRHERENETDRCNDGSYQLLPLTSPTQDDPDTYQRLNRGFMEQTLRR